ncbi:Helix-loop-helix DNA-binding domain protein, partial [Trichostrongylus colubriformis]
MYSDIESFSSDERGNTKKTNKPMMEKKRRARINHCLSELKEILICDKHASAGHAKWEKADILEMTVDYLKKLRALR